MLSRGHIEVSRLLFVVVIIQAGACGRGKEKRSLDGAQPAGMDAAADVGGGDVSGSKDAAAESASVDVSPGDAAKSGDACVPVGDIDVDTADAGAAPVSFVSRCARAAETCKSCVPEGRWTLSYGPAPTGANPVCSTKETTVLSIASCSRGNGLTVQVEGRDKRQPPFTRYQVSAVFSNGACYAEIAERGGWDQGGDTWSTDYRWSLTFQDDVVSGTIRRSISFGCEGGAVLKVAGARLP